MHQHPCQSPCLFFPIINGWHEEEFGSHFVKNFSGRQHPFRKTKVPVHACWSPEKHQNATYFRKMAANFVCNICGKQFMSENALYDHNKGVHNEVESPCTQCDKAFRSKVKLAYHIRSTHAERESFHCDMRSEENLCIFFSTTMSNLRAHKKRVHEKTKDVNHPTLACGLCDYKTTVKFNLERHSDKCKKSVQANPIDLSCKVCHKKYSTKKILNKHAKLHDKQVHCCFLRCLQKKLL